MILMVIIFVVVLKLVKAVNRKKYEIDRIKEDENIDNKHISSVNKLSCFINKIK